MIQEYLEKFDVDGKCFILITVAPKGKFPLTRYGEEFNLFVQNIFPNVEKYIGIYNNEKDEILQDVAFKLFTMPLIGDNYEPQYKITNKQPRATEEEIQAYSIIEEFYKTVPHGEGNEGQAIERGKKLSEKFLNRFPLTDYEISITKHSRNEDGTQYLVDMNFNYENEKYYFNKVYVY